MLKKTNFVMIGKKSSNAMIGKKSGTSMKSLIEKQMNNQYKQKSPLER